MKLLVYSFNSFLDPDIYDVLIKMNISFDTFKYDFNELGYDKNNNEKFVKHFLDTYDASNYDALFSIDYWPPIAEACYRADLKYIAWSYDCPLDVKCPEETLCYPNVKCFLFDKIQKDFFTNKGLDNVFYMPLGINQERYKKYDYYKKNCDPYRTQVSFIGKLYENSFPLIANSVNEKTRDVLKRIIEVQRNMPQKYVLDQLITDDFVVLISNEMHQNDKDFKDEVTKGKIIYALESQIARLDRITILNMCGRRYKTDFYSGSRFDLLEGVTCHPYVNYWTEMPWIFAASKINLNPSLPSIHSGMNLRSLDITACGGFLLMNRQPELPEFFKENEEIVVYDSIIDLIEKIDYYLSHESVRSEIAKKGRIRCFSDHKMEDRLSQIFKMSGL